MFQLSCARSSLKTFRHFLFLTKLTNFLWSMTETKNYIFNIYYILTLPTQCHVLLFETTNT